MTPLVLEERELPIEAMHPLVVEAGREGVADITLYLRARGRGVPVRARSGEPLDPRESTFVAYVASVAVAVCVVERSEDSGGPATVALLYVHPAHRRKGLGTTLLVRAAERAKRRHTEIVVVARERTGVAFLTSRGFTRGPALGGAQRFSATLRAD